MLALPLALLIQQPPRAPAPSTGRWTTSTEVSKVDDSKTIALSLRANPAMSSWPSQGFVAILTVRCKEHQIDAYITPGMPATVQDAGRPGTVNMWLDQDPPIGAVLGNAPNRKALVFADAKAFVYEILPHQRLLFRFTPFNSTPQETSFDLRGLGVALQPVARACKWDFLAEAAQRAASATKQMQRMAFLVEKLRSPDADDRAVAAGMIGKSGAAALSALPALIVALREDRDSKVRARAADACRWLGPIAKSALPTLREAAMTDESDLVKNEARQAIAAIDGKPEP
jgi:HEAT repeats